MKIIYLLLLATTSAQAFETYPDLDFKKPIYTREAALFCESRDALMLGINARDRGWHYTPTAGIKPKNKIKSYSKIVPADLGCIEYAENRPIVFVGDQFFDIETTDGFTIKQMIKN